MVTINCCKHYDIVKYFPQFIVNIKSMTTIRLLGSFTLACCSAALTALLYNYFHQEETEVLFFYGTLPICNFHRNVTLTTTIQNKECFGCKLNIIIGWLDKTKRTLDICMYMLNYELLSNAIIDAHKRGVKVRIILNEDNLTTTWKMGNIGISKRVNKGKYLMHHKFVIIDNKKVILGSMNWTKASVRANWENVFITNNCELVNPFRQEFQKLWKQFD